ncbi:probable apyrase 6 [Zingiber officinale]|uniref:probable apyrase 6 n=1 Tax=Zingiber officinale TaxID=94328 RepID=UPI001C4C8755|nr:probable apyrase 6 [Zingiber officinale]
MDAPKLPIRPSSARFFPFISRSPSSTHNPYRRCIWISVSFLSLAFLLLYIVVSSRSSTSARFGIVIDGGSSGTRIHIFSSKGIMGGFPLLDLKSMAVMRKTPGLSSYLGDPELSGESLVELLEFAKEKVPNDWHKVTEVRLMATAGLRMVEVGLRERILESCRRVLRVSGFQFKDDWATVIPGSDEGVYAWVAANYALGSLGSDPENTTGILELGGASAQVTFVSNEALPPEFSHVLTLGNTTYKLYSNSFLHFGQNVARESLQKLLNSSDLKSYEESDQDRTNIDPCSPNEFSHGGNFSKCRSAALTLLQKEKDNCLYQQCQLGSSFFPKVQGEFIATENFYYTSKFFGLNPRSSLSDLILAGREFCEEDWSKNKQKYPSATEDLSRYCFSAAYIVALLHDSFGIPLDDRRIEYANQAGGIQIEWALGAYLTQATNSLEKNWTKPVLPDNIMLLFLVTSTLLAFAAWLGYKWKQPGLKTIYDLEKGRYITTRVS